MCLTHDSIRRRWRRKKERAMAKVILRKGQGREFKAGGAWIYDNEIDRVEGGFENGDIVELLDFDDYFLGYGFINEHSKIRVRIMSRKKDNPVDLMLLEKRVRDAWNHRKNIMRGYAEAYLISGGNLSLASDEERADALKRLSCRLIFGEADFIPGITIDKFSDVLVIESLALGTDRMKEKIIDICKKVLAEDGVNISGVYERSDAKVRELEGLERTKGFIGEPFDTKVLIEENGIKYYVDEFDPKDYYSKNEYVEIPVYVKPYVNQRTGAVGYSLTVLKDNTSDRIQGEIF